jgi:hypothetical protein
MNDRIEELLSMLVASQVLQHANSIAMTEARATGAPLHPTDFHVLQAIDQLFPIAAKVRAALAMPKA